MNAEPPYRGNFPVVRVRVGALADVRSIRSVCAQIGAAIGCAPPACVGARRNGRWEAAAQIRRVCLLLCQCSACMMGKSRLETASLPEDALPSSLLSACSPALVLCPFATPTPTPLRCLTHALSLAFLAPCSLTSLARRTLAVLHPMRGSATQRACSSDRMFHVAASPPTTRPPPLPWRCATTPTWCLSVFISSLGRVVDSFGWGKLQLCNPLPHVVRVVQKSRAGTQQGHVRAWAQ